MKAHVTPLSGEITKVQFSPVREVRPGLLPWLLRGIESRRVKNLDRTYGAYVLRGIGEAEIGTIETFISEGGQLDTERATFTQKRLPVHRDSTSLNEATLNRVRAGTAEVIILGGSVAKAYTWPEEGGIGSVVNGETLSDLLFDHGVIDLSIITTPDKALKTVLNAGDSLLFDASQLHVFRPSDDTRVSEAIFVK